MGNSALTHVKALPTSRKYPSVRRRNVQTLEDHVTRESLDRDLAGTSLNAQGRRRIVETLGVAPPGRTVGLGGLWLERH